MHRIMKVLVVLVEVRKRGNLHTCVIVIEILRKYLWKKGSSDMK